MDRHIEDQALRIVFEQRIRELWTWRTWYRTNRLADWTELRREHAAELRALVRLARKARDLSRPAIRRADPTAVRVSGSWTESELRFAYGDR